MKFTARFFGSMMISAGVLGFVAAAILSAANCATLDSGAIPAVSLLLIVVGMCFFFPTLLEESPGQVSTMRVIILAVVLVFVLIYTRIGWNSGSMDDFKIDPTWVYILGLAFGAKAAQKFAEEDNNAAPPQ